jgi:hypothetical protein
MPQFVAAGNAAASQGQARPMRACETPEKELALSLVEPVAATA